MNLREQYFEVGEKVLLQNPDKPEKVILTRVLDVRWESYTDERINYQYILDIEEYIHVWWEEKFLHKFHEASIYNFQGLINRLNSM